MRHSRLAKMMMLMRRGNPFAYRDDWLHTIYVATTGNDTTGNGSKAAPYATLTKALAVAVAGDGILLADGTYAENTASSGALWLNFNFASQVVIEAEKGAAGNVTIMGDGGAGGINVYFAPGSTNANQLWRYLNFGMDAGTTQGVRIQCTMTNVEFEHCTFTPVTGAQQGVYITPAAITNLTFDRCTVNKPADTTSYYAVYVTPNAAISGLLFDTCTIHGTDDIVGSPGKGIYIYASSGVRTDCEINITDCTITGGMPINVVNGGNVVVDGCDLTAEFSVTFGVDGSPASAGGLLNAKGTIKNSTITKTVASAGHALLMGANLTDSVVDNVSIPQAYDYALVVKENTNTEVKNCTLVGGSQSALYFKAAVQANAHNNSLSVGGSVAGCFRTGVGDSGHKCDTWQFQNNTVSVSGTAKALDIGDDTDDAGGGVCDYNTYQNNSGLGAVRSDADVQSLAELQAAWADYDVTTNDAHSTIV